MTAQESRRSFPWLVVLSTILFGGQACTTVGPSKSTGEAVQAAPEAMRVAPREIEGMIFVPVGEFLMGSNSGDADEQPVHPVTVAAFYMDTTEVTVARYTNFLNETGYPPPAFWSPELDRQNDPVVGLTWNDAFAFCRWEGKRLPTEAEWEKAARGGLEGKMYPWGDDNDRERANFSSFGITPIGSYPPNPYNLFDMAGNVWEWCQDWYGSDYYSFNEGTNPKGPRQGFRKVIRGGAWYCKAKNIRVANRHREDPNIGSYHIGFRCAMDLPEEK